MLGVGLAASVRARDLASEGIDDIAVEGGVGGAVGTFEARGEVGGFVEGVGLVVRLVRRRRRGRLCRRGP